ncbi:MAG: fumarylacetoacetate hydrolase family protein [Balneolaceae bacterium]|nr:fumarylacetoacetate hydrolase family protein [Balneolaceae bacterium]
MNFIIPEFPLLNFGSIYCIGRNYAEHIKEMKSIPTDSPVVFLKPRSSIVFNNGIIKLPEESTNVHHEVELVLLIGKECHNISKEDATDAVKAIAVGIDVTARDVQSDAKRNGLPWTFAKGFDTFAPIGNFVPADNSIDLQNLDISVHVNSELRQLGNTSNMIFTVNEIISYLSHRFTLYPGDLIFTGTPEGVSQIHHGDKIDAQIGNNLSSLTVHVQA